MHFYQMQICMSFDCEFSQNIGIIESEISFFGGVGNGQPGGERGT